MSAPKRITLIRMLRHFECLVAEPSSLTGKKLLLARLDAMQIIARGWRTVAGYGEPLNDMMNDVGEGMSELLRHRNVSNGFGRPEGSETSIYQERDQAIIADVAKGKQQKAAILERYPEEDHFESHARRIRAKLVRIRDEEAKIIPLQTPEDK